MVAKVFKSGNSRAIRIPKGLLPENVEYVDIEVTKEGLVIRPKKFTLDDLFEVIKQNKEVTEEFLSDRAQPKVQQRDLF